MIRFTEAQHDAHQRKVKGARVVPLMSANEPKSSKEAKYRNTPTIDIDGDQAASKREAKLYHDLRMRMVAGEITGYAKQVRFRLVPKQEGERAVDYIADAVAFLPDGRYETYDAKGMRLSDYVIKRKLMKLQHGITVIET